MYYGKPFKMPSAYDPTPPLEYVTEVKPNKARENNPLSSDEADSLRMWQRPVEVLNGEGVKELHRLQAENAKLRELVKDMWANQEALPYGLHIEIRDRMRELEVEE